MTGILLLGATLLAETPANAPAGPPTAPAPVTRLSDLTSGIRDRLAALEGTPVEALDPVAQLQAVFGSDAPYEFTAGALRVLTDSRWFSTLSARGNNSPLLELRRWPGDTILALYAVEPGEVGEDATPPILGARLERVGGPAEWREWRGELETEAGWRPVSWIERTLPEARARLGYLLLPGDAGLGQEALADLLLELHLLARRVEVRPESWRHQPGVPAGERIALPETGPVPGTPDENDVPWQVARGTGFSVGLPPGFRARRLDGPVPPPLAVAGGQLWMRGRFVDQKGELVAVGDALRAGYIAEVRPLTQPWVRGEAPPLGAPEAKPQAGDTFGLAAERADAKSARGERWAEPGFSGSWIVFRLAFADHGLEIGLPVLSGRESPSLYWIPVTLRLPDRAPAPPPVDPADRFGIRFQPLRPTERKERPWSEGNLFVPGLQAEVPKGWYPAASLRSDNGYPVRFMNRRGHTIATLVRVPPEELDAALSAEATWEETKNMKGIRAARVLRSGDSRFLFVAKEGHGFLFDVLLERSGEGGGESWMRMIRSVMLMRPEP